MRESIVGGNIMKLNKKHIGRVGQGFLIALAISAGVAVTKLNMDASGEAFTVRSALAQQYGDNIPEGAEQRMRATLAIVNESRGRTLGDRLRGNNISGTRTVLAAYDAKTNGLDQFSSDVWSHLEFNPCDDETVARRGYCLSHEMALRGNRVVGRAMVQQYGLGSTWGDDIGEQQWETMTRAHRANPVFPNGEGAVNTHASNTRAIYNAYNAGQAHRSQGR